MTREKITHERRHIGLRVEILDELLNSNKRRSYNELLDALNKSLEENEEIPISERTLKYDIAFLENKKGAPIHRPTKKDAAIYYTEKFSIKSTLVDEDDIAIMKKAVAILKKATDIKLTSEIDEIISRLENKIHTNVEDSNTMIAFEEHTEAKGNEYFDELFSAIQEKSPVKIIYEPFGKEKREWVVHPYMLKKYRNRWFLIGRVGSYASVSNIALDRIKEKIRNTADPFIENDIFDPETYFNNLIGVTIPGDQKEPSEVIIRVSPEAFDYIRTKPIHKSQRIIKKFKNGSVQIELTLFNNYELKSTLLSYGPWIEIIKPKILRDEIHNLYLRGSQKYEDGVK
jgi:predicted DNA-binding transcriptional regulator YafY